MKKIIIQIANFFLLLLPAVANAQTPSVSLSGTSATLSSMERNIVGIMNSLIPVLAASAIVFFFYGLIRYIYHSGDAKGRATGRSAIIWGLIGLFVIFALYGILNFLGYNLGLSYSTPGTPILPNPNL
jgi:hypothetical protein